MRRRVLELRVGCTKSLNFQGQMVVKVNYNDETVFTIVPLRWVRDNKVRVPPNTIGVESRTIPGFFYAIRDPSVK